jgi:hypothetical protein
MNSAINFENEQRQTCKVYGAEFFPSQADAKVSIALTTLIRTPINDLRHPPKCDTTGWYIWGGKDLSSDSNFFQPLHFAHLQERCPEVLKYMGLPPGWRFLVAQDYVDVWFDPKLLDAE